MKTLRYTPSWRRTEAVELIGEPDAGFFARLTHDRARFVLLSNGSLWWGDAFTVLHADILESSRSGANPVVVGVLRRDSDAWTVFPTQGFANGTTCSVAERDMLRALVEWRRIEAMLGPFHWRDNFGEELP